MGRQREIDLERELAREREWNVQLQRDLNEHRQGVLLDTTHDIEPALGKIVHTDAIVFSPEVKTAVLAVALRLEERADKHTLPNGLALCDVEVLYERSGALKELLGDITDDDLNEAAELLTELIGSR